MPENEKVIRLLLVDDEAEFRQATVPVLTRRGYTVTEAADGMQAIAAVRQERPDVVLLDLKMPGLSGIETLQQMRAIAADLPVIILTGHGQYADALAGIKLDIVDFLQKPMDVEELAGKIRTLLEHRAAVPLREKTIKELMISPTRYPRLYDDQAAAQALQIMTRALRGKAVDGQEPRLRSILVYDRKERFLGILRFSDMLRLVLPEFLEKSPYSSYFTGMFLAQCKVIGNRSVGELLGTSVSVEVHAPLIQAVHLMLQNRLVNLPVVDQKQLVGVIREVDVILEMGQDIGVES